MQAGSLVTSVKLMQYELFYVYSPHASNKWNETEFDCITLDFLAIPLERVAEFPFLQQLEKPRMHRQVTDLNLYAESQEVEIHRHFGNP